MLKNIKDNIDKINRFVKNTISNKSLKLEIVFFSGIFIINYASFLISKIFGMYFLGLCLIAYSLYSLKE